MNAQTIKTWTQKKTPMMSRKKNWAVLKTPRFFSFVDCPFFYDSCYLIPTNQGISGHFWAIMGGFSLSNGFKKAVGTQYPPGGPLFVTHFNTYQPPHIIGQVDQTDFYSCSRYSNGSDHQYLHTIGYVSKNVFNTTTRF